MAKKEPLVRGEKLTGRGKEKLQSQMRRAKSIMEREVREGRGSSEAYKAALKIRKRARKLLGKEVSPGKKASPSKGSLSEGARGVVELVRRAGKAPGRIKAGLEKAKGAVEEAETVTAGEGRKKGISKAAYAKHFGPKGR